MSEDTFSASKSVWDGILLLILGASWGLQFTLLKLATAAQTGETGILALAMSLIALVCFGALVLQRALFRPTRQQLKFFFLSGLFGFVLPLGGIILAADYLTVGLIVLFESLTPVFTLAIALLAGTEAVNGRRIVAVILGVASVLIVSVQFVISVQSNQLIGLVIVLVVPLAYAIDGIYVASCWPTGLRTVQVVTGEAIAGAAIALFAFSLSGESMPVAGAWGKGHAALFAFVLISLLEIFLYFYLLKHAGALFVSMASFVALFSGFAWGIALLGESHSSSVWLAVGLVCVALYLVITTSGAVSWSRFASK